MAKGPHKPTHRPRNHNKALHPKSTYEKDKHHHELVIKPHHPKNADKPKHHASRNSPARTKPTGPKGN